MMNIFLPLMDNARSSEGQITMSSFVYVCDRGGTKIRFRKDSGVLYPPNFPEDVVSELAGLQLRDDDVLIAAWMRSGTHWAWELVNMILKGKPEYEQVAKLRTMLEFEPVTSLNEMPSPRTFNSHLHFRYLPEDRKSTSIKVIYLLRDPRDALCSCFQLHRDNASFQYSGNWKDWLPVALEGKFDWGSWFDHVREWEKDFESNKNLYVHFVQYENMLKDPLTEAKKISKFLGSDINEKTLKQIVEKCHFDRMKEDKEPLEPLQGLHFKKGKAGTWKSVFTVEQYEMFEKMYREKMAGSKFEQLYRGPVDVL